MHSTALDSSIARGDTRLARMSETNGMQGPDPGFYVKGGLRDLWGKQRAWGASWISALATFPTRFVSGVEGAMDGDPIVPGDDIPPGHTSVESEVS